MLRNENSEMVVLNGGFKVGDRFEPLTLQFKNKQRILKSKCEIHIESRKTIQEVATIV